MTQINLTNVSSARNIVEVLKSVNDIIPKSLFGIMWLIVAFIITFIVMLKFGIRESFAAASFLTLILTILLRLMDMVSDYLVYLMLFLAAAGAVWMLSNR